MSNKSTYKLKDRSYSAALRSLKEQYGPDVMIVGSAAAADESGRPAVEIEFSVPDETFMESSLSLVSREAAAIPRGKPREGSFAVPETAPDPEQLRELQRFILSTTVNMRLLMKDIGELKSSLRRISLGAEREKTTASLKHGPLYAKLLQRGLMGDTVDYLLAHLNGQLRADAFRDESLVNGIIKMMISSEIKGEDILKEATGGRVVALIGPTGSGKTTTIAKLASLAQFNLGKSVAFITVDTYRIGAYEQLKSYADIMEVPIRVAFTEEELHDGLEEFNDKDLIFIDTMGYSRKNKDLMDRLSLLMRTVPQRSIHLVASATAGLEELNEVLSAYSVFSYRTVIFTKLDETNRLGKIYECLRGKDIPLSFVTNGQNVPEDILSAQPELIAKVVVDGT